MARTSTKKNNQFRLILHGRIILRDSDGEISDVTQDEDWGLKSMAEGGEEAIDVLNRLSKRLDLLFLAAEHRSQMDASLVRLAIEDIRSDLEDGGELKCYLRRTQKMFNHSEALPPFPTPNTGNSGSSLTLVKPAS